MTRMEPDLQRALQAWLLGAADDELVLGHRNSEWCGHAPILEEDIAFANIALDEIGHARLWYAALARLSGEDPETYPDRLVYGRSASEFRNLQLVELRNGDWAFTMLRQYLFDSYEMHLWPGLAAGAFSPVAEVAAKIATEERYHHHHTRLWIRRLGLGTDESNRRLQRALDALWPYQTQLFSAEPDQVLLVEARILPGILELSQRWRQDVETWLTEAGLRLPDEPGLTVPRRSDHTPHLAEIVADLQEVVGSDPSAEW